MTPPGQVSLVFSFCLTRVPSLICLSLAEKRTTYLHFVLCHLKIKLASCGGSHEFYRSPPWFSRVPYRRAYPSPFTLELSHPPPPCAAVSSKCFSAAFLFLALYHLSAPVPILEVAPCYFLPLHLLGVPRARIISPLISRVFPCSWFPDQRPLFVRFSFLREEPLGCLNGKFRSQGRYKGIPPECTACLFRSVQLFGFSVFSSRQTSFERAVRAFFKLFTTNPEKYTPFQTSMGPVHPRRT